MSKKLFAIVLVVLALLTTVTNAEAKKRPPKTTQPLLITGESYSWFGTFGVADIPHAGVIYAASMNYPDQRIGFYTISGNAFVGQTAAITKISGTCFTGLSPAPIDTAFPISAVLIVDGGSPIPLFDTTYPTAAFSATALGQSFIIRITTPAPMGCNVLLESK